MWEKYKSYHIKELKLDFEKEKIRQLELIKKIFF
jgi:hypothetical protein